LVADIFHCVVISVPVEGPLEEGHHVRVVRACMLINLLYHFLEGLLHSFTAS